MPNALSVAGSDSVGGAGLQADLKAFEAVGVHACTVVTCVTSQNTKRVSSIFPIPLKVIAAQLDSVIDDVRLDAVKTGMLYSAEIVSLISSKVRPLGVPVVVDPVMMATTGSSLHEEGFVEALISKLLPISALVTPNLEEASRLSGVQVKDERSARRAASEILEMGADAVLIKGGHLKGGVATDYMFTSRKAMKFSSPKIQADVHGTGCTLGSLIAGNLALGFELEDAVRRAKGMIYKAILSKERVGAGVPCANPLAILRIEASKATMLGELEEAGKNLESILDADMIPEVGTNLGYAVLGALEPEEVAGFDGRIVRVGRRASATGCARFGASKHVARIVLAASSHDTTKRCAMNIKYSRENLAACKKAGLAISNFSRAKEPKGVSSMTWGVNRAIERFGGVPDIIFDTGGIGKEPMIRIIGKDPLDVLSKLKRIKSARKRG